MPDPEREGKDPCVSQYPLLISWTHSEPEEKGGISTLPILWEFHLNFILFFSEVKKGVFSHFPWGFIGTMAFWEHDSCGRRWKQVINIFKYYSHSQISSPIAERDLLDLGVTHFLSASLWTIKWGGRNVHPLTHLPVLTFWSHSSHEKLWEAHNNLENQPFHSSTMLGHYLVSLASQLWKS